MTSSENHDGGSECEKATDAVDGFEPRALDEIREEHGLGEDWQPRFAADTPRAERKAEEYEEMGFEARVFPHPDDVGRGEMPGRGDRCVVYTRPPETDTEGGFVDDELL